MRIALVAPPWHAVPPSGYGGVERMVAVLAEGLQTLGHDVLLFARSDSTARVPLRAAFPAEWSEDLHSPYLMQRLLTYQLRVFSQLVEEEVDVVHLFGNPESTSAALALTTRRVVTVQHPVSEAQAALLASLAPHAALLSISETHRASAPDIPWAGMILGAVDETSLDWPTAKADFLVQLARICPEKGQHLSIAAARRAGLPLVLGGFVDRANRSYFDERIKPWLGQGVEWCPDIAGEERRRLLSQARAMVFPIAWDEPFGTAMAEAMASGTPVVAYPRAAALEVVDEGTTGYLATSVEELADRIEACASIDVEACARHARARFGGDRFAREHDRFYRSLA